MRSPRLDDLKADRGLKEIKQKQPCPLGSWGSVLSHGEEGDANMGRQH